MIFEDVNKAEVELLLSNHKQVPASSLLYLINYAGLTDRYMERNNISVTWDNIGNLMLYHKLYNSLPSVGIRLKEPHEDLIKGVLLCKITNRDFLFSESNFKEDCKRYSKEYANNFSRLSNFIKSGIFNAEEKSYFLEELETTIKEIKNAINWDK